MENTLHVRRAEKGQKGVSQSAVASATGMSFNRYWRIENNQAEPTPKEVKALARYFRCDATVIFPALAATKSDGASA